MKQGEIRFVFFTIMTAVTVGLILSVFEGDTIGIEHALLKWGYLVPAFVLTVDMWAQYNRYYLDRNEYKYRDLFLDVVILGLSYIAFVTFKADPVAGTAEAFQTYPSSTCWIALIMYSVLKTYRAWPICVTAADEKPKASWVSVLHVALLGLILSAWGWQQGFPFEVPIPFEWSGLLFSAIAAGYLFAVYQRKWDPLTPFGIFRKWSD